MNSVRIKSPAKINLFLRVLARRADGYHELETLFQAVGLYDELVLAKTGGETSIEVPGLPDLENRENLVMRALRWIENRVGRRLPVKMRLTKRIPTAGGLGGGSSNGAAALLGIRELFGLDLDDGDLGEAALQLGADVPFFLVGGTAVGEGVGERLTPAVLPMDYDLILVNPPFPVSTGAVFREYDLILTTDRRHGTLWQRLAESRKVADLLENDLERACEKLYPEIRATKDALLCAGAKAVLMTGSGPTVFAVVDGDGPAAETIRDRLPGEWNAVITRPIDHGVIME